MSRAFLRDAVTRGGTPEDPDDVRAVSAHIRGPFRNSIASRIGPQAANAIACSAEALMSGLQPDRLLRIVPPSRGPWLLVSDRDTGCPFVRDVRRVTNIVDLLIETDALPRATIVIDARCTPIELVTMAAMLEDLADTIQVVLVGASQGDAETFRSLAGRAVTFTDVYEPLALDRRAPRRSEPIPKMRAPRRPR